MVIHLLAEGTTCPLSCGIICHPAPEKGYYTQITAPSMWHLADHDMVFKDSAIATLRQEMQGRNVVFEHTIYEREFYSRPRTNLNGKPPGQYRVLMVETLHGFAARPSLGQEASVKAFEEANTASVAFLKKHLGL